MVPTYRRGTMRTVSLCLAALLLTIGTLGLTSCSGTASTKLGTPEFYWSAAKETYAAGDYTKTLDHLDHLIQNQNEHAARAVPWSLVLTSGVAAGYMEIAGDYAAGARASKSNAVT